MATHPSIRPADPRDHGAVRALLRSAGLVESDLTAAHWDHLLVLEEGNEIAGCIAGEILADGSWLLRSLAVAEAVRGRGHGERLVQALEARAVGRGVAVIYLLTETAADFFQARGYAPLARADAPGAVRECGQFSSLCPGSAVLLRKSLRAA
ncbi:MAG: GNAT family N-acetyltransferase [Verrucomicrobia bacterium]|nr:GNAT family N-acetyltransferase [Verrucomicrobiota bacterium]